MSLFCSLYLWGWVTGAIGSSAQWNHYTHPTKGLWTLRGCQVSVCLWHDLGIYWPKTHKAVSITLACTWLCQYFSIYAALWNDNLDSLMCNTCCFVFALSLWTYGCARRMDPSPSSLIRTLGWQASSAQLSHQCPWPHLLDLAISNFDWLPELLQYYFLPKVLYRFAIFYLLLLFWKLKHALFLNNSTF